MTATQHLCLRLAIVLLNLFCALVSFKRGDRKLGTCFLCLSSGFLLMTMDLVLPATPAWIGTAGAVVTLIGYSACFVTGWLQRRRSPGSDVA
jgi:hypothetical protein